MLPQGRRRRQQPRIRSILQPHLVRFDRFVRRFFQPLHPFFLFRFALRVPLFHHRNQLRLQMHAGLLHALHHPRVDVLLEFGERPFAVEFHIRPRLLQRLPRRAFEPLQGFGRNPVHLIAETRRNHLRVFGHLVALAVRNFLGRVVDLRAAVLHVGPAVMVQLRRQQTRNLRRAIAQRRARLLHHLLER